jgi:hypothetical protein
MSEQETSKTPLAEKLSLDATASPDKPYEEFEIGEHKVPWFLWVFFTLILVWASLSWIKFFGY